VWGVWSTKARGGYAELLCLGEALLLVTLMLAQSPSRRLALLWGILAGLALWTHLLAVVFLAPAVVFIILARRHRGAEADGSAPGWSAAQLGVALGGAVLALVPLIVENLANGFLPLG